MTNYWQIASGAYGRDYSEFFIRYGIASFFWQENDKALKLLSTIQKGDIIILKSGITVIKAVGKVVEKLGKVTGYGDKDWLDFDGWQQPYYVYVEWYCPPKPFSISISGLKQGTISGIEQTHIKNTADLLLKHIPISIPLPEPKLEKIEDSAILKHLIQTSLSPSSAENLTNTLVRIRLLAEYYEVHGVNILEHETRTFLVIPLLLALGWREQQLKIEYGCKRGKIDIACFSKNHSKDSTDDDCIMIIETKAFWSGLDFADKQVEGYAQCFKNCKKFVSTNGFCYKVFEFDQNNKFNLIAYLNLLRPSKRYPLDNHIAGALEAITMLMP